MQSLNAAVSKAQRGDLISIAPEGTRSTTGQVLPFKKGPFHVFEDLKTAPIIPVVIMGAYDLYPPGRLINIPGRVYIKYLPPIMPSEASDKDKMSRLVRRRILTALLDTPPDTGKELGAVRRLLNLPVVLGSLYASVIVLKSFLAYSGLAPLASVCLFLGVHCVVTVLLYMYY